MNLLTSVFAIDIAAYAVMSNHYHLVIHINQAEAQSWDKDEVIKRWTTIFYGPYPVQKYLRGEKLTPEEDAAVDFTAHRMIGEYQQKFYQKHHKEVVSSVK